MPDAVLMPAPVNSSTSGWRNRKCASCSAACCSLSGCGLESEKVCMMRHTNRSMALVFAAALFQLHAEALHPWLPVILDIGRYQDTLGLADQQFAWHETEVARIAAIVAVIAQHQVMIGRHGDGAKAAQGRQLRQDLDAMRMAVVADIAFTDVLGRQLTHMVNRLWHAVERGVLGWLD